MASTLAQQLAQLQVVKGPQAERHVHGKLSLLFDYQKAADVSAEQLLALAQQGLDTLCKADKRFTPFQDSLFSRASLSLSRDQLTKEENSQLDTSLGAFLHVLTNHFLVPAAFQALEYCIRRYKAHVHNVGDLFVCALPYHSTPQFARLVAVLQLQGTPWEWLSPCQQTGAPPPRPLLVQACVNHQAVLREICRGAQSLGVAGFVSRTYLSFYAVLLCEVLMAVPQVTEDLLALLLPFLVSGLQESATRDYRAATLMVLTQLLSRASLSKDFLTVVSVEVCRCAGDLGFRTALMLLAHLAGSQPHLKSLPAKALLLLAEQHEETGQQLGELQTKGANLAPLLQLLLHSLTHQVPGNPQLQPLLLGLLQQVQQEPPHVQAATVQLLRAGCRRQQQQAAAGNSEDIKPLQAVLRVLDSRYPDQLDAAVNQVLQEAAATAVAAGGISGGSSQAHGKPRHHTVDADSLFGFVQRCFHGSSHEVVTLPPTAAAADGAAHQQQALTLSLAVSAPAYQMRIMGLKKLDAICTHAAAAGGGGDDDDAVTIPVPSSTRQLLHSSLLSCLRDDVFAVAGTAAAAAGLAEVPVQEQLPALQSLLTRAAETLAGSSSPLSCQVSSALGSSSAAAAGAVEAADAPAAADSKRRKKKRDANGAATAPADGGKHTGGALALNRAVVGALASAVAAGVGPSFLPELTSLVADGAYLAAEYLDATSLPTKKHLQELHIELQQLNLVLLLAGVKSVLAAATADSLVNVLGQPAVVFSRLATAAVQGHVPLLQHLHLIAATVGQDPQQQLDFLAGIFGLPQRVSSTTGWQLAGGFAAEQLQQLVSGLRVHEALLRDSAGVISSLLCSAAAAMETEGGGGGSSTSRASSKAKHGKAGVVRSEEGDDANAAADLQLPGDCVQALQRLLVAVLPQLRAPSQLLAAQLSAATLSSAVGGVAAGAVAAASNQLLRQLVFGLCSDGSRDLKHGSQQPVWQQLAESQGGAAAVTEAHAVQHQLRTAVAVSLTGFYNVAALQAEDGADAGAVVDGFVSLLQLPFEESASTDWAATVSCGGWTGRLSDAQLASIAPVRAAVLQQLDAAVFEALPASQQQAAFSAVLRASATDGDSSCRAAARSALERLPVTSDMLLVLFNKVGGSNHEQQEQQLPNKGLKRQKRVGSSQGKETGINEEAASLPVLASDLDSATAALELLLWKDDVADVQQLVQPLQRLLRLLVPLMGSIVESHQQSASEQQQDGGEATAVGAAVASASAAGYAASLVLLVLRQLAQEQLQQSMEGTAGRGRSQSAAAAAGPAGVDAELVLSCASAAPDGAVRNAALQLLTVLAQVAPQDMLAHVLQALSVVQQSAALQEDSHSKAVASATLAALVPAWLASGKGSQELWTSLIDALPGLPALCRLALLSALLAALPEEMGLSVGLLLMMRRVVASNAAAAGTSFAADGSGKQGTAKKAIVATASAAQSASSGAADGVEAAGSGASEMQWLPDLMAALCDQAAGGTSSGKTQRKMHKATRAAAAGVYELLAALEASEQPMIRQLALVAGEAAIRKFGQLLPSAALSSLPVVLAAVQDGSGPVRVSALVFLATSAAVLGTKWDHALAACGRSGGIGQVSPAPALALLELVAAMAAAMEPSTAAAVRALAATVMKLSESKFKPFFLRMQEWATTSSTTAVDASGALSVGRAAAFLAAVNMFGQRLRSVFVPYYRYYSALLMKHLVDDGGTGGSGDRRAKKKRKSSVADSSATTAATSEALQLSRWLARLRAVRAVHLLAVHESAAGLTSVQQDQQERFERLLPLVVEQLAAGPPAVVASVLADEGADSLLDLPGGAVAALGPVGRAVVEAGGAAALQDNVDMLGRAALGASLQMAVAGGSDVTWKPLHHAVLMVTRGGSVRAKLLALGGVSRLAELLKEEYLMLLPEALPFVSELIEDGDVAVEGAAQGLVAQLEELSGEKLEQYLKT
eukprot:gene11838-11982_t